MVSDSHVTWATPVPILVFLGLSVLDLGPMYVTDVRQHHRLMPPPHAGLDWPLCHCAMAQAPPFDEHMRPLAPYWYITGNYQ